MVSYSLALFFASVAVAIRCESPFGLGPLGREAQEQGAARHHAVRFGGDPSYHEIRPRAARLPFFSPFSSPIPLRSRAPLEPGGSRVLASFIARSTPRSR